MDVGEQVIIRRTGVVGIVRVCRNGCVLVEDRSGISYAENVEDVMVDPFWGMRKHYG